MSILPWTNDQVPENKPMMMVQQWVAIPPSQQVKMFEITGDGSVVILTVGRHNHVYMDAFLAHMIVEALKEANHQ